MQHSSMLWYGTLEYCHLCLQELVRWQLWIWVWEDCGVDRVVGKQVEHLRNGFCYVVDLVQW